MENLIEEFVSFILVCGILSSMFVILAYIMKKDWTKEEHERFNKSGHWK